MSACVINLTSPQERFDNFRARQQERKRTLLNVIREVNAATVHPLSHHRIDDAWSDRDVYLWALWNDLLSAEERTLLSTIR